MEKYAVSSRFFHWMIALIVISLLIFSFFIDALPQADRGTAFLIHKSLGFSVLVLGLIRLFWIYQRGRPALPLSVPRWERIFSRSVQGFLYLLLVFMPLTGWVMSVAKGRGLNYLGLFQIPLPGIPLNAALSQWMNSAHKTIAWILIALISFHILGALKHQLIDKDAVFKRMWF